MKFVFARSRTVTSKYGHTISFEQGIPTHVPPEMYQEVIAVGGITEDDIDLYPPKSDGPEEPTDPVAREAALFAAFEVLALHNKREDFTAGGQPHPKALARELGWVVSNRERDAMWVKFNTKE